MESTVSDDLPHTGEQCQALKNQCRIDLKEADALVLHIYARCSLNPGEALDRLAIGAAKAIENSSAGSIWFTRYEFHYWITEKPCYCKGY